LQWKKGGGGQSGLPPGLCRHCRGGGEEGKALGKGLKGGTRGDQSAGDKPLRRLGGRKQKLLFDRTFLGTIDHVRPRVKGKRKLK